MNDKQKTVYDIITEYKKTHDGNSPSLADIGEACGFTKQQAGVYVAQLVALGKIAVDGTRQIDAGGTWTPPTVPGPLRCAWCDAIIAVDAGAGPQGSDGICQPCLEQCFTDGTQATISTLALEVTQ